MGKTCGNCQKWLNPDKCPRAEYKDRQKNLAVCLSTDEPCELFEAKKKEKKQRPVFKDSGIADEGYFEAIYHNDAPSFLTLKEGTFSIIEKVHFGDREYSAKENNRFPYEPYEFFSGDMLDREALFWKVREEFQRFIDVESIWLDILSSCVLLSYQQDKLQTVPYIFLYGDNESGKSTVLQLLKHLCYRPMYAVTCPPADLYGYLEDVDSVGCILEDEIQGIDKDIDKIKIYKAGYKQGAVVPRTIITQHDRKIRYYNTFGFKACASEQIPHVKGFRERFLEVGMIEGFPSLEWTDVTPEDLKRLRDLRNTLLKWRMLSREWQLPNPELQMRGRIKELWKPILQITHGLTIYDSLANFAEEQRTARITTKQDTLEGHIIKVVLNLYDGSPMPFPRIWDALVEELEGKLDEKRPHVMDTAEFFQVTKSKVGYRLREVLSGKSKKIRYGDGSTKAYNFDREKLRRIAKKYGYVFVPKFLSESSSGGVRCGFFPSNPSKTMLKLRCSSLKIALAYLRKSGNSGTREQQKTLER